MRALRAIYVLAVLSGATYLGLQEAWNGAAIFGLFGLFKARTWVTPWFAARRALGGAWRPYAEGAFEALVPYGWNARLTDTGDLFMVGTDAWVRALCVQVGAPDPTQVAATYLEGLGESMKLRDHRPATGSIGGLPATGQAATFATYQEVGTIECLATRWSDGRSVVVITWCGLSIPDALLTRCTEGVNLRALT